MRSTIWATWLSLLGAVAGEVVNHDATFTPDIVLRVTSVDLTFDCEKRQSIVVNGSSPGPYLSLEADVTTWVRVYNDISDQNLTMHWHGLSARVAPFSDGTPQAAQWPIPPAHYFDYELHPVGEEAGTYFYHSHVGFQAGTCYGPLIVEDKQKPYPYDEERIVMLGDYFNSSDTKIHDGLLANPFVWSGEPDSLLVNGKSGTANKTDCHELASLDVKPGKTYRVRFIGVSALSHITLALEGHEFDIIEADGSLTKPYHVDHMQVGSGQRFSVLLKTKSQNDLQGKKSFWMQLENRNRPLPLLRSYALVTYDSSDQPSIPQSPVLTLPVNTTDWLEYALQPMVPNNFPSASEVTRTVVINMTQVIKGAIQWDANDLVWKDTSVAIPYLPSIYDASDNALFPNYDAAIKNNGWDPATLAFPAKLGEVLEIIWQNEATPTGTWDVHPMHAHGGHYYDIGSGNGTYDRDANEKKLAGYNPVLRDSTFLYRYAPAGMPGTVAGWRAWRIRVQYPGVWMLHCHTLQHIIMGMQTAWVFGTQDEITQRVAYPDVGGYLTYGGSVNGNDTHSPRVNHYFP